MDKVQEALEVLRPYITYSGGGYHSFRNAPAVLVRKCARLVGNVTPLAKRLLALDRADTFDGYVYVAVSAISIGTPGILGVDVVVVDEDAPLPPYMPDSARAIDCQPLPNGTTRYSWV